MAAIVHARRQLSDERGIAMVSVLLCIVVASILGTTVMQLSFHSSSASAQDRSRTQAIHAAEAGLTQTMAIIDDATTAALPCTVTGTLSTTPPAAFSVAITYYAQFTVPLDPVVSTLLPCSGATYGGTTPPGAAKLVSTGSVPGWPTGTVERYMESAVQLTPERAGFNKAIFSDNSPTIGNNLTVLGEDGNNGDVYTNGSWTCVNSVSVAGSVYVQGTASMANSCRTAVDLWAKEGVTMQGQTRVDHDLKSSTGSITMANSASVGNDIVAAGTCTGCSGRAGGTITTGNVQSAPPSSSFPDMSFDATAWAADDWAIEYFNNCTTARDWILNSSHVNNKTVLRITGGCTLSFSNNTTVTRGADLAIFTDGEVITENHTTFTSSSADWHDLFLIVQSGASCAGTDGRVSMSNLTQFTRLYFFVYSPCYSTFANNNSSGRGQIYGKTVAIGNHLTFSFHSMYVPGNGDITGYGSAIAFVREID